MRFAGSAVESYLGGGPNMGALTQNSAARDAQEQIAGYQSTAKVGGIGARQLGETMGASAVGAAQANLAGAQANAQMMSTLGSLGGSLIGGLGNLGGGYGGFGSTGGAGDTFNMNSVSKYGDAVQNPMDSFRRAGITGPIYTY